jgi:ZIP family zinc transporter
MLAFVGGIMMAVCALELWPEGKKCGHDRRLLSGVAVGVVVMGWTLWMGA